MKIFTIILLCVGFISFNVSAQFAAINTLEPLPITTSTTDKPQSKVWTHDGKQWAVLADADGVFIWRLDGKTWTKNLKILVGDYAKADCKVVNDVVHILLFRGNYATYLVSAEYNPVAQAYFPWKKRPDRVAIPLEASPIIATLDIDGKGRMWVAYYTEGDTKVKWSDTPYSNWSSPVTLGTGGKKDEMCSVIAIPALKKVAVLWSNHTTQRFGLRMHTDGADPEAWSELELPGAQGALSLGAGLADDHLDMVAGKDGTLYCVVKTSYDTPGHPKLALLVRRPKGSWDNLREVSQSGTRPIIILNEELGKLKVIYTSDEGGGSILYRDSHISKLEFSQAFTLIDGKYNYATSSKAAYSKEVLILVTNVASASLQAVGFLAIDTPFRDGLTIQATPNPFTTKATISFVLASGGDYTLSLYDSKGVIMSAPHTGTALAGKLTTVEMDGSLLSAGLYLVRLDSKTEGNSVVRLMHEW